jgi:hypothetical protein
MKREYTDRREMPRYTAPEAARLLKLPESTVWAWFFGQPNFSPLFDPADRRHNLLSFYNLIEAHVLSWTKQQYPGLKGARIRSGLEYVRQAEPWPQITEQTTNALTTTLVPKLINSPPGTQLLRCHQLKLGGV